MSNENVMNVSEIFSSIQGEGPNIGRFSTFIRLYGCNLSCSWCDSKHAINGKEFKVMSIEEIASEVYSQGLHSVVITGGEPTIYPNLIDLLIELVKNENIENIEIETNGYNICGLAEQIVEHNLWPFVSFDFNISPKEQTEQYYHNENNILELLSDPELQDVGHFNLKFVIEEKNIGANMDNVLSFLDEIMIDHVSNIYLMAEGFTQEDTVKNTKKLIQYVQEKELTDFLIAPRLHTLLWGNERKK